MHPEFIIRTFWLAWVLFWIISARGTKITTRRESTFAERFYRLPIFLGAVLLFLPHRPGHWLSLRLFPLSQAIAWSGTALVFAGLAFTVWARVHLGRNWSGRVTLKKDHELIRTGPYGRVRHPIYTGLILALLGTAVALGEWRGFVAFAFLTCGFILKLRMEERWLCEVFGEQYARYKSEVPALFPGIY